MRGNCGETTSLSPPLSCLAAVAAIGLLFCVLFFSVRNLCCLRRRCRLCLHCCGQNAMHCSLQLADIRSPRCGGAEQLRTVEAGQGERQPLTRRALRARRTDTRTDPPPDRLTGRHNGGQQEHSRPRSGLTTKQKGGVRVRFTCQCNLKFRAKIRRMRFRQQWQQHRRPRPEQHTILWENNQCQQERQQQESGGDIDVVSLTWPMLVASLPPLLSPLFLTIRILLLPPRRQPRC